MAIATLHDPCETVAVEVGLDLEFHQDPDFAPDRQLVAENLVATHARSETEMNNGAAAARTAQALGCGACMLSEVCAVRSVIETMQTPETAAESLDAKVTMFATAPDWLRIGRANLSDTPESVQREVMGSDEALADALANGTFDLDYELHGVANTFDGQYTKADLPELSNIKGLRADAQLDSTLVITPAGVFRVIDARDAIGFKKAPLPKNEQAVLYGKLLNRMCEADSKGRPLVLTAASNMQKAIVSQGGTTFNMPGAALFEMRMNGKNRLYFTTHTEPDGSIRIIILGSHGGDENTQHQFLDVTVAGGKSSR